jgi:ribosome-associated translation inhibitor RaiA
MKLPLQISFKNLARDEHITEIIKEKAAKLDRLCDDIIQCRVMIDIPHRNHKTGNFYSVRLDISVPGVELAASREADNEIENKDIHHVLKEAFESAYRQVEYYNRRRQSNAA